MMQSSATSSPATSPVTPGSYAPSAAATNPADTAFGPVLQQQADAQENRLPARGIKAPAQQAAGKDSSASEAAPETASEQEPTLTAAETAVATREVEPDSEPDSKPDSEPHDGANAQHPSWSPALISLVEPGRQLDTGKNLPAGGNVLPPPGTPKNRMPGNASAPALATDTELANLAELAEMDSAADLPDTDFRQAPESMFTHAASRGTSPPAAATHSQDATTRADTASASRHPDAIFAAALQKAGELAPGVKPEALVATAGSEPAADATSPATNPFALTGTDKLQVARPLQTALNSAATAFQIDSRPGTPGWNNQVTDSIRWMSKADISVAELKLNPAELGSIEVRIYTEDQQTRVSFITSHAATREIIEATLPRLREMLQSNGLQLEHSDISHNDSSRNLGSHHSGSQNPGSNDPGSNDKGAETDNHARREDSVSRDAFFNESDGMQGQGFITQRQDFGEIDQYV